MVAIEWLIGALLVFALLIFVLSFLKKDRVSDLENQLEALSIQVMQENYQLKKRVKILEEELIGLEPYSDQNDTY